MSKARWPAGLHKQLVLRPAVHRQMLELANFQDATPEWLMIESEAYWDQIQGTVGEALDALMPAGVMVLEVQIEGAKEAKAGGTAVGQLVAVVQDEACNEFHVVLIAATPGLRATPKHRNREKE